MCEQSRLSRRRLFGAPSAALAVAAAGPVPSGTIGGDRALRRIMDGNARYLANNTHVRDLRPGARPASPRIDRSHRS